MFHAKLDRTHSLRVVPICIAAAMVAQPSCKASQDYGHLIVNLSVAGLTPAQRALVHDIVIQSQVDGNTDPGRVYRVSVTPAQLNGSYAYHLDYIPDPQTGHFAVTVQLADATSQQLALKTQEVSVRPKAKATATFDFTSTPTVDSPCKPEADATELTSGANGGISLVFLWDRDHYLVVYDDQSQGDGDLASIKLDASGKAISTPIFINASPRISTVPSIVKDGGGYVVAWQEGRPDNSPPVAVDIRRLNADGAPVGNIREIATTSTEARPYITTAYGKLAIAWFDDKGTPAAPNRVAEVAFLRSDDFSFDGTPVELSSPGGHGVAQQSFPAFAVDGPTLSVSWVDENSTVFTANVSDKLAVSAPLELYTSTFVAQQLDVVSTGDALFAAWEDLSGDAAKGRERIRGTFTTPSGAIGSSGIVHEIDTGSANWPRLAWNGNSVAVVYYQYRDFGSQIFLSRFSPQGERMDGVDNQLTNVPGQAKYPQIRLRGTDLGGDHFGVGWVSNHTGKQRVYFAPVVCQ